MFDIPGAVCLSVDVLTMEGCLKLKLRLGVRLILNLDEAYVGVVWRLI